ncbi:hypothetical protein SUGI_0798230 [Cryptomeria japonica]|nr:hypothetical protein SUGI_0798230 [Cryptomeria japonica]
MDYKIVEVSPQHLRCQLHESDFPPIAVASDEDGVLWSNDNRRLWLFRKAGVPQIVVKYYYRPLSRAPPEPRSRELMARKDYFPRIRWRKEWPPSCISVQEPPVRTLRNPPLPSQMKQESEKGTRTSFRSEQVRQWPPPCPLEVAAIVAACAILCCMSLIFGG